MGSLGGNFPSPCLGNQMRQLKSNAQSAVQPLSPSLVQLLKNAWGHRKPCESGVLRKRWPGTCLTSARPHMSFVSDNAPRLVGFRRQLYGLLTSLINIVSARPRAQDILAAMWSL